MSAKGLPSGRWNDGFKCVDNLHTDTVEPFQNGESSKENVSEGSSIGAMERYKSSMGRWKKCPGKGCGLTFEAMLLRMVQLLNVAVPL